jgi:hypothetical protein
MKTKLRRPSPAMLAALLTLFVALGGSALAYGGRDGSAESSSAANAARASHHAKYRLRVGKLIDTDTTAHDGVFNFARGHAQCKRGERLISGGLRLRSGSESFVNQHAMMVESGPVPKFRQWFVTISSDLGGAARKDFSVLAYCLGH